MSKTFKRLSVGLSKEDARKLENLASEFGENRADIIHKALSQFYYLHRISQKLERLNENDSQQLNENDSHLAI